MEQPAPVWRAPELQNCFMPAAGQAAWPTICVAISAAAVAGVLSRKWQRPPGRPAA